MKTKLQDWLVIWVTADLIIDPVFAFGASATFPVAGALLAGTAVGLQLRKLPNRPKVTMTYSLLAIVFFFAMLIWDFGVKTVPLPERVAMLLVYVVFAILRWPDSGSKWFRKVLDNVKVKLPKWTPVIPQGAKL